ARGALDLGLVGTQTLADLDHARAPGDAGDRLGELVPLAAPLDEAHRVGDDLGLDASWNNRLWMLAGPGASVAFGGGSRGGWRPRSCCRRCRRGLLRGPR